MYKVKFLDGTVKEFKTLVSANLSYADLSGANLRGANLLGANLSSVNLRDANLRDAKIRCADLSCANLSCADLSLANLSHANLSQANLSQSNLSQAKLRDAGLRYCTGNDNEVKSIQTGIYKAVIYKDVLSIGCQQHTFKEWADFNDSTIKEMDKNAYKFYTSKHMEYF